MARVIDNMKRFGIKPIEAESEVVEYSKSLGTSLLSNFEKFDTTVLDITNVREYVDTHYNREYVNMRELPSLVSPFSHSLLEFDSFTEIQETFPNSKIAINCICLDLERCSNKEALLVRETIKQNFKDDDIFSRKAVDNARWNLDFMAFFQIDKTNIMGPVARCRVLLNHDGKIFYEETEDELRESFYYLPLCDKINYAAIRLWFEPAIVANSFMNCKNVQRIEHEPPSKVARKYKKKTGKSLVKHYILNLYPLKKRETEVKNPVSEFATKKSLHIRRGHFKTYTEEKPLMGKHTGVYFWGQHIAGSKSVGVVKKDYKISTKVK